MLITGARVAVNAERAVQRDVYLVRGRISFIPRRSTQEPPLELDDCMVLPGLVNAHDHLEFNLFPRLGRGPYSNATAWARDIYHPTRSPIRQHLGVPKVLRLRWGAMKNLLAGVTTVAHHNPLHLAFEDSFPVRVMKRFGWAHSLQFSPDWKERFCMTSPNAPFLIHAAEGTDCEASSEIGILDDAGVLGPSTVLIHGVGIGEQQLKLVQRRKSSVIWCPTSNHFTLGRSLCDEVLRSHIPMALATDSALTGQGDLLDELRFVGSDMNCCRLYRMVTSDAASILRLPRGSGEIHHGGPADLLVMRDAGRTPAETVLNSLPELVIVRGQIALASEEFAAKRLQQNLRPKHAVDIEGRGRYFTASPLRGLMAATKRFLREELRLAGRAIAA